MQQGNRNSRYRSGKMCEVNKGEERGQVPASFIILASSTTKKENRDFSEEII